jgi:hypothetical protein
VWERSKRVIRLRQPCICRKRDGRGSQKLRTCGNHAHLAAELALAIHEKQVAEASYWDAMKHQECCGSMASCPLNRQDVA